MIHDFLIMDDSWVFSNDKKENVEKDFTAIMIIVDLFNWITKGKYTYIDDNKESSIDIVVFSDDSKGKTCRNNWPVDNNKNFCLYSEMIKNHYDLMTDNVINRIEKFITTQNHTYLMA